MNTIKNAIHFINIKFPIHSMTGKPIQGLFAILALGLLAMPAYADTPSPLKQVNMGIPIDEIQCNNDTVLMQSTSGKPYCLSEGSAARLVDRGFSFVVLEDGISIESKAEISKIVWSSKDFVNLNSNEDMSGSAAPSLSCCSDNPPIIVEVPSQVRIGDNFTVGLKYSYPSDYPDVRESGYDSSVIMGFTMPKQFELVSTEYPLTREQRGSIDWYGQFDHYIQLKMPDNGPVSYEQDIVFKITEPLLYDDHTFTFSASPGTFGHVVGNKQMHLLTANDVLTMSPIPLAVSGSDDSKFPDRDKKPPIKRIKQPFYPGLGPNYDNLNSLPLETQESIKKHFKDNWNMTAPQSNKANMSPDIEAKYLAWLESISQDK